MTVQQGEKAELAHNYKASLSKFQQAARELDKITKDYPSWSPTIVKYRKDRTAEAIVRVQEALGRFGPGKGKDTGGEAGPSNEVKPALPGDDPIFGRTPPEIPGPDSEKPLIFGDTPLPKTQKRGGSRSSNEEGVTSDLDKVGRRIKELESELAKAQSEISQMQADKSRMAKQLDDATKAREASDKKQAVLQKRADFAEAAVQKATNDSNASAEQIMVTKKEYNDARRLLSNSKIEAEADAEYRRQLDERYKAQLARITALMKERDDAKALNVSTPGKIAEIQKQLDATKKEKETLAFKLQKTETQLTEVSKQRDDALAQVTKLKEAQKQVDKLVSDNATLMAKLADAQKSVAQFKTEGVEKDKQIAELKTEVSNVKQQLEATKKQSADYQQKMGDLQEKLEQTAKQLADTKSEGTESVAEKKKMQEENRILRDIVLREQRKEADRQAMKKIVLGELNKLEINSRTLLKQIDFLSEPTLKLTPKERALFKKPELQVTDTEISLAVSKPGEDRQAPPEATAASGPVNSEISVPDEPKTPLPNASNGKGQEPAAPTSAPAPAVAPPAPAPVATPAPPKSASAKISKADDSRKPMISLNPQAPSLDLQNNAPSTSPLFGAGTPQAAAVEASRVPPPPAPSTDTTAKSGDETQPLVTPETAPNTALTPPVPTEFIPLARQGKELFERGNYLDAEKAYRKILAKSPRNLYALSNLGVVLFRSQKYKLAEEMFNKAIAVAPEDGFSHCTLGIVYYQETKLDEAVNELTKALAINPKNPTAHNYLGITASQKGWPEAAQKELETAVSIDPSYADAYFNLAVVFATQQPPNKEEARKYYKRAIELGAEADPALEQLIK
jgi:Flp pilus assembly protein TadD